MAHGREGDKGGIHNGVESSKPAPLPVRHVSYYSFVEDIYQKAAEYLDQVGFSIGDEVHISEKAIATPYMHMLTGYFKDNDIGEITMVHYDWDKVPSITVRCSDNIHISVYDPKEHLTKVTDASRALYGK